MQLWTLAAGVRAATDGAGGRPALTPAEATAPT